MVSVDFKIESGENRGIYYSETERIIVYPLLHENLEDLLYTINHELIHAAIDKADETHDEDQEEKTIFRIQWADEFIV